MKALPYIIIALLVLLIGQYFYYRHQNSKLSDTITELREEQKRELKRARDSAYLKIETITKVSKKSFDSILAIPPTIKYVKYEKPYFINRSLDDALQLLSNYRYNAKPTEAN